ncbi:MAG: hypothetical protein Q8P42_09830 [Gallionella sp.]|nr:hypothetical protein [Gallionella sp.]
MFPSFVRAAESAPAAAQPGMAAGEHANHAAHGDAGGAARTNGAAGPAAWTAFPTLKTKTGGESRERRVAHVVPQNIVAGSIDAYSNNVEDAKGHRQLPLEMSGAKLDKPENGGFHWLTAREEQADKVRVASTVQFFSERGAQNPTALFMRQKYELEIIPQPYPREHSRYRANENWQFLLRFNGKPLAGQWVRLETQNGTRFDFASDAQGVVTVGIPDDFKKAAQKKTAGAHDHGRLSADFVLATEYAEGGKTYLTAFNASYGADAFYQRNLAMGLGFTLLGMIGAAPLLRQRKNAKQTAETANNKEA